MYQRTVLSASPSSFGSRHERSQKLSPPPYGSSFEDYGSRRSSFELTGNNAVSFPNNKPPLYKETGVRMRPPPTIGFAKAPLENIEYGSRLETMNNGVGNRTVPGLLSLTLGGQLPLIVHPTSFEKDDSTEEDASEVHEKWSLGQLQSRFPIFHRPVVVDAYNLAASAHVGQFRKSGEPVLAHCVETAKILAEINADDHMVAAALLHDVVDDTSVTFAQLESCVSSDVCDLVRKVSKLSHVSQLVRERDLHDCTKLKDVLIASVDCRAVLIKMADRIHNMRTASALKQEKQLHWARETMELFVPLAGRLGCWGIKSELEDLCFAILYPREHAELKTIYDAKVATFTQEHLQTVLNKLKQALDAAGIAYDDISGRPKNLYGVYRKMQKKHITDLDNVLDLFAIRIVVKDGQSCHEALKTVHKLWPAFPGKLKDYISNPKPNGYRSIHDVCFIDAMPLEVQIRTSQMHYVAEHGIAAHWRYKEEANDANAFVEQRTLWSRYVLNWVFELNDQKLRPVELKDTSAILQSIWTSFWSFEEKERGMIACRHGNRSIPSTWSPLLVVVKDAQTIQVCESTPKATLEEFLLDHCGILESDGCVPILNGERVSTDTVLQFGDLIEFGDFSKNASALQSDILPFESCRDPAMPR